MKKKYYVYNSLGKISMEFSSLQELSIYVLNLKKEKPSEEKQEEKTKKPVYILRKNRL